MNPGLSPQLVATRLRERRAEARAGDPRAQRGGRWLLVHAAHRRTASLSRALVRPVGRMLIRVGRRLAGPEPERPALALHRPGWSR